MSDAANWDRVKDVVHRALGLAPQDRTAFLHDACGSDQALQAEAESLLAAHAQAGNFAERPALEALGGWNAATAGTASISAAPVFRSGDRFGQYRIQTPLGVGGMGEVYRAHDATLGRDVAVKILRAAFAGDPVRLARFEREAHLLASLNHPKIGAIYGVEHAEGVRGLVLELVEGATLDERLRGGPLRVPQALVMAGQIAEALEAAHEKGIVHRDLKPANVKITPAGTVKVLDFGLAKATGLDAAEPSRSPTITGCVTDSGVLLGTASYMSPEQARSSPVDKRADIWAFGCVLYEMLTAQQAFPGDTLSDSIVGILEREPDWDALPAITPPAIRKLLSRCLEKDPKRRLHDIADARIEIDDALASTVTIRSAAASPTWRRRGITWGLVAMAIVVVAGVIWRVRPEPVAQTTPASVARFAITLPPDEELGFVRDPDVTTLALSPDGRFLAYVAGPRLQLHVRAVDRFDSTLLPGTENADTPFFSPDGQWLGFFSDGKLKKVSVAGGTPLTLSTSVASAFGASWTPDGSIIFAPSAPGRVVPGAGLLRVSADGGTPRAATLLAENESEPRWPEVLPDGKTVLFSTTPLRGSFSSDATIYLQSLETGKRRALVKGVAPHYVPTGHLVYMQAATLLAVPLDLARLSISGEPVPLLEGVQQTTGSGPQISVSRAGTIAYVPAAGQPQQPMLVWIERTGSERAIKALKAPVEGPGIRMYRSPRLSPDGQHLALSIFPEDEKPDLWVYDLSRDTLTRLTFEGINNSPVWTPDGRRLTFSHRTSRNDLANIYWKPADGSRSEERLLLIEHSNSMPFSWSPDGRVLAFMAYDLAQEASADFTRQDLWWLSLEERTPHLFLQTKFAESAPVFSPDGRWLAYVSDESGHSEIYVRPFPGPGGKWPISNDGGVEPVWPSHGHELFYRSGDAMMAVDVKTEPTFSAGQPRRLFEGHYVRSDAFWANYDVTPDGQRFVMVKAVEQAAKPTQINVVVNWREELQRRIPLPVR